MKESPQKINVGIICGGHSCEHEISLLSARNIFKTFDRNKFEPFLIYIDRKNGWFYVPNVAWQEDNGLWKISATSLNKRIHFCLDHKPYIYYMQNQKKHKVALDVCFPIIHGSDGEDGCLQGMLKLLDIPFSGALSGTSYLCMDKELTKIIAKHHGIATTPYLLIKSPELNFDKALHEQDKNRSDFPLPLFVKPCRQGSSVGVSKITNYDQLADAVLEAFRYDSKVLIEKGICGREIEIAMLGNENECQASCIGEIRTVDNFYSYKRKYLVADETELIIPTKFSEAASISQIQQFAQKIYSAFEITGFARIDMFYTENSTCYLNEINTLPGFTDISMYPNLWRYSKLPTPQLLERLIDLAFITWRRNKKYSNL